MSSVTTDILNDIVQTLRDSGLFQSVTAGSRDIETAVPRAIVSSEREETLTPDDSADTRWGRLRIAIKIHTRCGESPDAVSRIADLAAAVIESLLDDPFRSDLCCDLPVGRATEIDGCRTVTDLKRPEVEAAIDIRCHFEIQEAQ